MQKRIQLPETLPDFSERRRIRECADISGSALAAHIGVAPSTLYGWETVRTPKGLLRKAYFEALQELNGGKQHVDS